MTFDPRTIVAAKRDGKTLDPADVSAFVEAYTATEVSDALAAAFLMACLIRGLDDAETLALTRAMVASGATVSFKGLDARTVDKHSTGGVADGVTLVFAPIAAALGLAVAKLSGRGLGHTGGTLDKLESIPGFRTDLTRAEIEAQVGEIGCAVAAQSPDLVPADGALYSLRDATATVPSVPLIAASVMSKKLAVDTDLILLDVKAGSGAFMRTPEDAEKLARTCLALADGWGRSARAAVTDMSQPLGDAIGNALDIVETVSVLRGEHRGRLRELAIVFAARALSELENVEGPVAIVRAEAAIDDGAALERFAAMVQAQGGDPRVADDPWSVLDRAPVVKPIVSSGAGVVAQIAADEMGSASGALGAGRIKKTDRIDPAVGIVLRAKIGEEIAALESIGEVHAREEASADEAIRRVLGAITLGEGPVEPPQLVHAWLGSAGSEGP
jgi:pyrimidine-nucleoside phosphorylase